MVFLAYATCMRTVSSSLEPISDLPHGEDVPRRIRVRLELPPQLGDVNVDGARRDVRLILPHLAQQRRARRDGAFPLEQRQQQVKLAWRQCDEPATAKHGARRRVHFDLTESFHSLR